MYAPVLAIATIIILHKSNHLLIWTYKLKRHFLVIIISFFLLLNIRIIIIMVIQTKITRVLGIKRLFIWLFAIPCM
ncbi:MAG: hypothetical protein METHAR1v1_1780009 [Methanothrix sp.]|nr:MAG: hypothetical protein METHAR1v1_1780009 [Methanothrix sp.]